MIWIWILLLLFAGLFAFKIIYTISVVAVLPYTQGALFVSTAGVRINAILDALSLNQGQTVVDLGCGDGRMLRAFTQRFGVNAIGYEINPLAYFKARIKSLGTRRIRIRWQNFWMANLSEADVIVCYLFPDVMSKLTAKLRSELHPGTIIVSCNFALPGFVPQNIIYPKSSRHSDPIYFYRVNDKRSS